jgi:hypothetical protein
MMFDWRSSPSIAHSLWHILTPPQAILATFASEGGGEEWRQLAIKCGFDDDLLMCGQQMEHEWMVVGMGRVLKKGKMG